MKKSEKQEQNQGEVEDEGADRKYQVFFWTESIRSSVFFRPVDWKYQVLKIVFDVYNNVLSLLHLMHTWYMYQVILYYYLPFGVLCFVNLASPSVGMSL